MKSAMVNFILFATVWIANRLILSSCSPLPSDDPSPKKWGTRTFTLAIVSDMDERSKSENGTWISYLRKLKLLVNCGDMPVSKDCKVSVQDTNDIRILRSNLSEDGRGMELSELTFFNNQLLTCDDKTGYIFNLSEHSSSANGSEIAPRPWIRLLDGNGTSKKGFKCEWMTVKDHNLWAGSHGTATTKPNSTQLNENKQFVKKINPVGNIEHIDWRTQYRKIAEYRQILHPGYITHESVEWSDTLNKWAFLPRKASKEAFDPKKDAEEMGDNFLILCDQEFKSCQLVQVGTRVLTQGFSSFKWIPGTKDELAIALKTVETDKLTETYIMSFSMDGTILLPPTKISDDKYEGLVFLDEGAK